MLGTIILLLILFSIAECKEHFELFVESSERRQNSQKTVLHGALDSEKLSLTAAAVAKYFSGPGVILEIGCGDGDTANFLPKSLKNSYVCIDPLKKAVDSAKSNHLQALQLSALDFQLSNLVEHSGSLATGLKVVLFNENLATITEDILKKYSSMLSSDGVIIVANWLTSQDASGKMNAVYASAEPILDIKEKIKMLAKPVSGGHSLAADIVIFKKSSNARVFSVGDEHELEANYMTDFENEFTEEDKRERDELLTLLEKSRQSSNLRRNSPPPPPSNRVTSSQPKVGVVTTVEAAALRRKKLLQNVENLNRASREQRPLH